MSKIRSAFCGNDRERRSVVVLHVNMQQIRLGICYAVNEDYENITKKDVLLNIHDASFIIGYGEMAISSKPTSVKTGEKQL